MRSIGSCDMGLACSIILCRQTGFPEFHSTYFIKFVHLVKGTVYNCLFPKQGKSDFLYWVAMTKRPAITLKWDSLHWNQFRAINSQLNAWNPLASYSSPRVNRQFCKDTHTNTQNMALFVHSTKPQSQTWCYDVNLRGNSVKQTWWEQLFFPKSLFLSPSDWAAGWQRITSSALQQSRGC